jgi:hypothetical protein
MLKYSQNDAEAGRRGARVRFTVAMNRTLIAALAALILAAPVAASAQETPSYAQPAGPPGDQQIRGRVTDFDGGYNLTVRDERGYVDNVRLHPGTIINPTGLTLAPGMVVSILGYNAGDTFGANEIDTPYTFTAGVPYYYGHPYGYYGPSFSLGFFFGNRGWWHGSYFHGGYTYYGGARYYNSVHIANVYRAGGYGGAFRGRDYVGVRTSGGYYRGDAYGREPGHVPGRAYGAGPHGNFHAEGHERGGGGEHGHGDGHQHR